MGKLDTYRYYGTSDRMTEKEAYHCNKYLKRKQEAILASGRFLIDTEALQFPFNLDCFHCHQVHRETCCENGQPYSVPDWQIPLLEQETPGIISAYFSPEAQAKASSGGIWEKGRNTGHLRLQHGNCIFYMEIDGQRCCSIHAYAESNELPVFPRKPFSCQLYPLDLIETGQFDIDHRSYPRYLAVFTLGH